MQEIEYNNNVGGSFYDPGDPGSCIQTSNPLATGAPTILNNTPCTAAGSTIPSVSTACPPPPFGYYGPDPIGHGGLVSALQELVGLDQVMAQNTDQNVAVVLQAQHDLDVSFVARYYSQLDSMDSAAAIMAYYGRYRDAFPFYMAANDFKDAATMYQNLPLVTDDDKLYAWEAGLMLNLYSEGQTWFNLDTASMDSLTKIVQYNSAAGYMAGGIAALLGLAPVTWPIPVVPAALVDSVLGDSSGYASRTTHGTTPGASVKNGGAQSFSVYPNPTYGSLVVSTTMSGRFTLYSMLGQQLAEYVVTSGSIEMQLPTGLASGIYIGEFVPDTSGTTQEVKLVYQQ